MTSKFSIDNRELLQRISSGEAVVGIDFGNLIVRELAAFRLAAMDSEPVAWIHEDELPDGYPYDSMFLFSKVDIVRMFPVFAPQPPLVPDEAIWTCDPRKRGEFYTQEECKAWNACRAAMLAAAQHSPGSEPATVPGKWIPVSERMPELGEWLVTDGCDFDVQLFNGEQFIPGFVWEDKITHWMPLPAVPQEVKGE
jgi:hypothetical protein|nr:MAG TPA: Protein of unknown function (DUF551) [Bacteriophage sp.]